MKHNILFTTFVALVLCGCAKSEVVSLGGDGEEINFSFYSGRNTTKATTAYNDEYTVRGFFGSETLLNDTFLNNVSTSTTQHKKYYWPTDISNSKTLKFYAVAPKSFSITDQKKVAVSTPGGNVDFMVDTTAAYSEKVASVPITFKHALTRLGRIIVKGYDTDGTASSSAYRFKITSLKINGKTDGTFDLENSSWELGSTSGDYQYIPSGDSATFTGGGSVQLDSVRFLIPQTFGFSITYEIYFNDVKVLSSQTVDTTGVTLGQGYNYSLTVTLPSKIESNKVIFNATCDEWEVPTPKYPGAEDKPCVTIGGVTWAPVNCGYDTNHPYGLLYQWGRKYGQAYIASSDDDDNDTAPTIGAAGNGLSAHPDVDATNANTFYRTKDGVLFSFTSTTLWNTSAGTSNPASKGTYDPCPEGWRVPTPDELHSLFGGTTSSVGKFSFTDIYTQDGVKGWWVDGTGSSSVTSGLFLPASGLRLDNTTATATSRGSWANYLSSSKPSKTSPFTSISIALNPSGAWGNMSKQTVGSSVRCVLDE